MTFDDADALKDKLVAAFPHGKATAETIALTVSWLMAMRHGDGAKAVDALIGTATFWPTIAEIREAAGIPLAAVPQLIEAKRRGVELVPDLGSRLGEVGTGWALAGEEAIPLSKLPAPLPALPAPVVSEEQAASYRQRLHALTSRFQRVDGAAS